MLELFITKSPVSDTKELFKEPALPTSDLRCVCLDGSILLYVLLKSAAVANCLFIVAVCLLDYFPHCMSH